MSPRLRWALGMGTFFVLSTLGYFFNVTPWLFIALIGYLSWGALRCRWSNSVSFTGGILGLLFAISIWQHLSPLTGLPLELSNFLFLSFLGFTSAIYTFVNKTQYNFVNYRQSPILIPAAAVVGITVLFLGWFQLSSVPHISFAMNGDAVWNTVTARFVVEDGGIVSARHPNPAPLTAELLASIDAPGRSLVPNQDLLLHDVVRQAQLWFVLLGVSSVLIMVLVAQCIRGASKRLTQIIALLSGLLPYTWFFSGFSFFFGFYNATIAILVLLAGWHAWLRAKTHPLLSLSLLSAASVILLATWAPLVVITGSLLVTLFIRQGLSYWFKRSLTRVLILLSAGLIPLTYFALFSLADFRREGPALSVDGGIFELSPYLLVVLPLLIALFTLMRWQEKYSQQSFWGALSIVIGGGIALGYLVWQRKETGQLWGYYPMKFSWLVSTLLILVLLTVLLQWVDFSKSILVKTFISLFGISAVIGGLMLCAKPLGLTEILSPLAVISSKGVGVNDEVVPEISQLAAGEDLIVVVHYGQNSQQDLFMNNWLLQLPVDRPDSLQRWYSYYLDGTDLGLVCKAQTDLKQPLQVETRDSSLKNRINQLCHNENITVRVVQ